MHRPDRSELGFLSSVYPVRGFSLAAGRDVNRGGLNSVHFEGEASSNASWERRCARKQRRSPGNDGCSPKRRRLMEVEAESVPASWDEPAPKRWSGWAPTCGDCPAPNPAPDLQLGTSPTHNQPCLVPETSLGYPCALAPQPCSKPGALRGDMEAAQRRLQEIEERITLEDDDDDEDLDVEPAQSRPVLVMSQSLREGLQQGLGDILPQNVVESVSHSGMELVVWRPPEQALSQQLRDSLEKQRKQNLSRQDPQATSSQTPTAPPRNSAPVGLYCTPAPHTSTEEDMEL